MLQVENHRACLDQAGIVNDGKEGRPCCAGFPEQELDDRLPTPGIQARSRLVRYQDPAACAGPPPRDRDPLLLAARQVGDLPAPARHPERVNNSRARVVAVTPGRQPTNQLVTRTLARSTAPGLD